MVGNDGFKIAEGDFSDEAGAWRRDGELYEFMIREGKEACVEVKYQLVYGADMLVESKIVQ